MSLRSSRGDARLALTSSWPTGSWSGRGFGMLLCILLLGAVGCSGTSLIGDSEDPIYVAKKVNQNKTEADKLLRKVQELDIERLSDNIEAIKLLNRVDKLHLESRELAPTSAGPRLSLGNSRQLHGLILLARYGIYAREIIDQERAGMPVSPSDVERRNAVHEEAWEWIRRSNRELEYYARNLMRTQPKPMIWEALSTNYEILREYEVAERMLRTFLQEMGGDLTADQRRAFEARARSLRQRRIDEFDG